ncbi:hypothetical protein [Gorillibacterium timonense]|uniref:hypothetical protein n=1 Tax=Gorillibacterium timonense TaxID=1689269 RepID=UPI00071CE0E1|nr:hypothetical protein [Gorillibacterium timonense]
MSEPLKTEESLAPEVREKTLVQLEDGTPLIQERAVHSEDGRILIRTQIVSAGFGQALPRLAARPVPGGSGSIRCAA